MIITADIISLGFAIFGVVSFLYIVMFKLVSWREEEFVCVIPLYGDDKSVFARIDDLRLFAEICSIHKKLKIVAVNYGAPAWFVKLLNERYESYGFLTVIDSDSAADELDEKVFGK